MPRPKQADVLAAYKTEVKRSVKWRKHEDYDKLWRRMIDLYRGRHYDAVTKTDRIVVNMAFATINVVAPAVSVNHPKMAVNARRPDFAPQAVVAEEVLNYEWRRNDFQEQFRRAVDDQLIVGHGWIKVGYKYTETPASPAVEPEDNDPEIAVEGAQDKEDVSTEVTQVVTEDRPTLERISPFDIYVDPDARNPQELRWIAQRIRRPLADVKRDKRYSPKARADVQATIGSKWEDDERPAHGQDSSSDRNGYVEVWEWWDLKTQTVCTFTQEGENFLIAPRETPYPFDHPYYMLRNYEVPDEFYPMGELEAIEVLQHELNATRTQMLNHRKRFSRKWVFRRSAFDTDGIAQLESDEDNVLVPIESDDDPAKVISPMPSVITPPEFYNQSEMIQGDINTVTAVSEYMRGSMPDIRRTATEAAMLQDAQNARSADKLAKVERSLSTIAEKLLQVLQTFLTGEHVVRMVGQNGAPAWVYYDRDYIAGEFDFEVEAGSTQPQNESFRRQSALQMMDAMAPLAEVINLPTLARYVLQYGFGVKNADAFVMEEQAQPPPGGPGAPPGGEMPALPQEVA